MTHLSRAIQLCSHISIGGNSRGGYSGVSLASLTGIATHAMCTHSNFLWCVFFLYHACACACLFTFLCSDIHQNHVTSLYQTSDDMLLPVLQATNGDPRHPHLGVNRCCLWLSWRYSPEAIAEHAHHMACSINLRSHLVRTARASMLSSKILQGRRIHCSARQP